MPDNPDIISVLLIEDNDDDILLLRLMLEEAEEEHIELDVARSLSKALERLHASLPNGVLLDLTLPDAQGLEALQAIEAEGISVPIVILTGLDDQEVAIEAVQEGAQDYLVKGKADSSSVTRALRYAIERQHLQQQLMEAQRREQRARMEKLDSLSVLAGGIAHDFNNLLTGISGNITLAMTAQEQELPKLLEEAQKATTHATGLTRQLLTFAKGGEPVKQVTPVIELLVDSVAFTLRGTNMTPEYSFTNDIPNVDVDPGQMTQVFQNIALNAAQAIPEGGIIKIAVDKVQLRVDDQTGLRPGEHVKITFQDQGPGIPEEHLSRIFDPYYTTKKKGSGLGLTMSYSIMQKHGGTMMVDSTIGQGTTFTLYLPVSRRPLPKQDEASSAPEKRLPENLKVLVMDDQEYLRKLLKSFLERLGCNVTLAEDGAEALAIYREAMKQNTPFQALIADLTIPDGMGGRELVHEILEFDPNVRALVSSGYSDDPVLQHPEEYGFCGIVNKPYRMEELQEGLAAALSPP